MLDMSSLSLWDLAIQQRKIAEESAEKDSEASSIQAESHMLVCGSRDAGKSSMLLRFLERDEAVKPTVALDFMFARKGKGNGLAKDIAHIWELGGGTALSQLIDVVISAKNVRKLSVVLVLDLSEPDKLWETQHILLNKIKARVNLAIGEAAQSKPSLLQELKNKAYQRIGVNHPDKNLIQPMLVPLIVVGAKFDLFQEMESGKKAMVCKTLRFLAHMNGAMLQFFSTKAEGLTSRTKGVLNHIAFNSPLSKTSSTDHLRPLIVPFGMDTHEQIGTPPVPSELLIRLSRGNNPYDLWSEAYSGVFPPKKQEKLEKSNPVTDPQFAEPAIDAIRQQKDLELERYRKASERKAKEVALHGASSGQAVTTQRK